MINLAVSAGAGRDLDWLPRPGLHPSRGARRVSVGRGCEMLCGTRDGQHKLGNANSSQHKACFTLNQLPPHHVQSCHSQPHVRAGARHGSSVLCEAWVGTVCAWGPVGLRRRDLNNSAAGCVSPSHKPRLVRAAGTGSGEGKRRLPGEDGRGGGLSGRGEGRAPDVCPGNAGGRCTWFVKMGNTQHSI